MLICPYFPPEGEIAAIRIGKFAEYWAEAGHEVTVLTRNPATTGTVIPQNQNIKILRAKDPLGTYHSTYKNSRGNLLFSTFATKILNQIKTFILIPDQFWLWSKSAFKLFLRSGITPDLVVASGAPISALSLGAKIARKINVPYVADYRDLISSMNQYPQGRLRKKIDSIIEKNSVKHASLITVASTGCAENLRGWFIQDIEVIENGFEPSDYLGYTYKPVGDVVNVVYTGSVYCEDSDLSPFFEAVSLLNKHSPEIDVRFHYYGRLRSLNCIINWAKNFHLENIIVDHGMVSHSRVTQAQVEADLLLLLMVRDTPDNQWVLSGKYYEYVGANRPILQIGLESGELAGRIRSSSNGFVSSNPLEIKKYLHKIYLDKVNHRISQHPNQLLDNKLTRKFQSLLMLDYLDAMFRNRS